MRAASRASMNSRGASELFSIDAAVMSASVSRTGVSPFTEPPGNCGTRAAAGLARVHRKSTPAPDWGHHPAWVRHIRIRALPESFAAGEVRLEEAERIWHVGPAKADPDMLRLVVDRAREEQDAGLREPCAVPGDVTDPPNPAEDDRAGRRPDPFERVGVPLEEAVQERQVAPDDREVAVEEQAAVPQRERGQELARRARADGGVILQHADGITQGSVAAGDPADPQPRQAVALRDAAERDGTLVLVARRRQPAGGIVL